MFTSEAKQVGGGEGGGLLSFDTVDDCALTPTFHRKMVPSYARLFRFFTNYIVDNGMRSVMITYWTIQNYGL